MARLLGSVFGEWHGFALVMTRHPVRARLVRRASFGHTATDRFPPTHGIRRSVPAPLPGQRVSGKIAALSRQIKY